MAIKLVYQAKKPSEDSIHLYGALENVPSELDEKCAYDVAYSKDTQHYFYTKSAENGVRIMGVGESRRQIPAENDAEMKVTCSGFDVINNVPVEVKVDKKKKKVNEEK